MTLLQMHACVSITKTELRFHVFAAQKKLINGYDAEIIIFLMTFSWEMHVQNKYAEGKENAFHSASINKDVTKSCTVSG